MALVFTGLTASTVLGAPMGAAVGQWLGWRFTFWTLVVFGGIALLGLLLSLQGRRVTSASVNHSEPAHHDHTDRVHSNTAPGTEYENLDAHALAHLGGGGHGPTMREQVAALTRPAVWGALLTTMLGYGGVFTSYVYIAPQLTEVTGFGDVWITPCCCYSASDVLWGQRLGGKLADRAVMPTVLGSLTLLALVLFGMTPPSRTE